MFLSTPPLLLYSSYKSFMNKLKEFPLNRLCKSHTYCTKIFLKIGLAEERWIETWNVFYMVEKKTLCAIWSIRYGFLCRFLWGKKINPWFYFAYRPKFGRLSTQTVRKGPKCASLSIGEPWLGFLLFVLSGYLVSCVPWTWVSTVSRGILRQESHKVVFDEKF